LTTFTDHRHDPGGRRHAPRRSHGRGLPELPETPRSSLRGNQSRRATYPR
jgi:hypothetical protein